MNFSPIAYLSSRNQSETLQDSSLLLFGKKIELPIWTHLRSKGHLGSLCVILPFWTQLFVSLVLDKGVNTPVLCHLLILNIFACYSMYLTHLRKDLQIYLAELEFFYVCQ